MRAHLLFIVFIVLACSGCGEPRRYGDPNGRPVMLQVSLERAFINSMDNRQGRIGVGVGGSVSSGGHRSVGTGVGLSFSSTTVSLLGGDGPGEAQVFRQELKWGDNSFTVPLTPGRTIHFTVQAQGGREGWEAIGSATIPDSPSPRVIIGLSDAGPRIRAEP